jgi:hypothetical protein
MSLASHKETLPFPGLKKSHLMGLPRGYFQNGPLSGKNSNNLKVDRIEKRFSDGRDYWAPILKAGEFALWRDQDYLFSDDSVVEQVDYNSLDSSGRSTHLLSKDKKPGSPIRATIYRRDKETKEYIPWREYLQRSAFTGTLDSDGEIQDTLNGDRILWSNVDTTKREFVTFPRGGKLFLQFNQSTVEYITSTSTPVSILDFNEKEFLGNSDETAGQKFFTEFFPVDSNAELKVYTINPSTDAWTQQTIVTSFTATNQVKVDTDLGIVEFGTSSTGVPPVGHYVYISYGCTPRVEYEEDGYGDEVEALTADVSPLTQSLNRGFVVLGRAELDIATITLETDKPGYAGTSLSAFGPVYVGADYAPLIATVYSSNGKVVPNIEVLFEFETSPSVGSIGGSGNSAEKRTSFDGVARSFYSPPNSADDMGYFVTTVDGASNNKLEVRFDANFESTSDVFTYYVLKDDPFLGKVGADTDNGEVEWSGSPPNGRKTILYEWDSTAINPVTGEFGAYAPVHPTSITGGNVLTYGTTLTDPDPSNSSTNLGAYWVVSDRYVSVRASAYSPKFGRRIYSNTVLLRVELPPYMKGEYVSDTLRKIPFGWRIFDDSYEYASAINGATWITINPVAGPHPIIDVIAGDTWQPSGPDYDYAGNYEVTAPFAYLSLYFSVVV